MTVEDIAALIPYLPKSTIGKKLKELVDAGIAIRYRPTKQHPFNATYWYTLPEFITETENPQA
jgi:predicted transcriptional regulator